MSPRAVRATSLVAFLCTAIVLGVAFWLDPDPSGVGTHTQLGLKPCIMLSMMGLPCPMCGMTTTFALMADLRIMDAFFNQPFGVVLFLVTLVTAIVSAMEIVYPKDRWKTIVSWLELRKSYFVVLFSVGFFGGWLYKIAVISEISTGIP